MSSQRLRLKRAARTTTAVAVVIAACAIIAPAAADAASRHAEAALATGVGLRHQPSVRVRALQRALVRHGYSIGRPGVDGRFGPLTRAAVRRAQRKHHLKVDGIAGPRTLRALRVTGAARTATRRRGHEATSHRTVTNLRPATAAGAAASRTASAPARTASTPAPVPLSTQGSGRSTLIVGSLALLIVALCAVAYIRQRRRYAARLAAYHLDTFIPPLPDEAPLPEQAQPTEQAVTAAEDQPTTMAPVTAPATRSGLQAGALVIGYATGPRAGRSEEHPPERDIERACERAGWQLVEVVRDRENGSILERPALTGALERITAGQAHGLVVNDARLLSRSVDFAKFVQWFRDAEAALIALDLGLDTSTPEGSRVASSLITLNGWAGEWIASRTRHSLADIRPNGGADGRLAISERPEVLERIGRMHEAGMAPQDIADELNEEGVPTLFGTQKWWPSSVQTGLRYWRAGSVARLETLPSPERSATG
jgi:DNA invertase Pin-like site-specific DNA recombinase/peptidoglycan hydrolase-like protein with peptidoglycan-binding domain